MNEVRRVADPTLLVVAAVYGLALVAARGAGLFGVPLAVLVLLSVWRYAYEVLKRAAQGRMHMPAPGIETMNPVGELGLVLHFAFFGSLSWLLADPPVSEGSPLAAAAGVTLLLVFITFPASAALMALTSSLAAALDPRSIAALIHGIGPRRYAAIPALAGALSVICITVGGWGQLGSVASVPLTVFGVFAVFLVIGLRLRAARDMIEIPGEKEPDDERAERLLREDWQKQLDIAYASIRSGLIDEGYRTISTLVGNAGSTDTVHRWVLQNMLAWEDRRHARAFGAGYVEKLLADGRAHPALELAASLRDAAGRFPVAGPTAEALAEYARSIGRYRLADDLSGE